jgi:hypothetical protein
MYTGPQPAAITHSKKPVTNRRNCSLRTCEAASTEDYSFTPCACNSVTSSTDQEFTTGHINALAAYLRAHLINIPFLSCHIIPFTMTAPGSQRIRGRH